MRYWDEKTVLCRASVSQKYWQSSGPQKPTQNGNDLVFLNHTDIQYIIRCRIIQNSWDAILFFFQHTFLPKCASRIVKSAFYRIQKSDSQHSAAQFMNTIRDQSNNMWRTTKFRCYLWWRRSEARNYRNKLGQGLELSWNAHRLPKMFWSVKKSKMLIITDVTWIVNIIEYFVQILYKHFKCFFFFLNLYKINIKFIVNHKKTR